MPSTRCVAFLGALLFLASCGKAPPVTPEPSPAPVESTPVMTPVPTPAPTPKPTLSRQATGEPALHHARALCALGSRGHNGPGLPAARRYLSEALALLGWQVVSQNFRMETPAGRREFTNLIARFPTADGKTILPGSVTLLAAHYDTPESALTVFPAASSGAAGCGVLLEVAALLGRDAEAARQVELVFWDGETPVRQPQAGDGLCGSRFFVHTLQENGHVADLRSVLVLGAVGHRGASWTLPLMTNPIPNSQLQAIAARHGWTEQISVLDRPIWSGHLPFFEAGLPVTLLTDANYLEQDSADDEPGHLDAISLKKAVIAAIELGGL